MEKVIKKVALPVLAVFIVMLISCERSGDEELPGDPVTIELTQKQKEIVDSTNKFAFDLFVPIISKNSGTENIMISPFSISSALSMVLNGAAGETFNAMRDALRYDDKTIDEINETYLKLLDDMIPVDERVIMEIANSVWVDKNFPVKQSYIDALKTWYLAEAKDFDITDPDAAVEDINNWIEDKTHDKIKDMLESLDSNTAMLLINAIYFNGKWRYKFDTDDTENKAFYLDPDNPVQVPMMYQEENFAFRYTSNATLVELPYGQGNYSMVVMLPDEGVTLTEAASTLNAADWTTWMTSLSSGASEVQLSLPRFEYKYKCNLNDNLSALGMGVAFTEAADFSNISDIDLLISKVLHQTYIKTDEEGTEAAAVTVAIMGTTSVGPSETVININRPFLYFIRETTTGTIVFMGQVVDPE